MSSNQWEVVAKSKKHKNLEKKMEAHVEKRKLEALQPKLEEILPSYQYQNLVSGKNLLKGIQTHSPAESTSSNKSKSPKKHVKTIASKEQKNTAKHKKQHSQQQQVKISIKPKSLEIAMRNLTPDDFISHLEQLKLTYPGSELLWLKGIASYFSANLPFECDPIFSGKSLNYPSNLASKPLKVVVIDFLDSVGEENLAYFYHTLLTNMATELLNNQPIVGYKFLLQLIGQNFPQICSNNMAKTAMLRNSYQNRSNVCLSILWAIGQGGYQRLMDGIKVWQNLMLPNLELKSYVKYIVEYIERILLSSVDQSLNLNEAEFFSVYNALNSNTVRMSKELQESLLRSADIFLQKYIVSSSKHANLFVSLLREIKDSKSNRIELDGCLSCLTHGVDSFKIWKMNYKKQLLPTTLLLQKIDAEWDHSAEPLNNSEVLKDFLNNAKNFNDELKLSKRVDPQLDELIAIVKSVQEKAQQKKRQTTDQKKKCGCCKWFLGSVVLLALIAGALNYDTQVNGKGVFAKSATGKLLQNAGVLPHVEKAWYTSMGASARGYKWAEKHVPPYAQQVGALTYNLYRLGRNTACNAFGVVRDTVKAKLPVVANFLEQYVPGLPKKIEVFSIAVKNVVVDLYGKSVSFVKTNVLVGRLSPENMSKALNETKNAAWDYYYTFHKKVDAYAKLK